MRKIVSTALLLLAFPMFTGAGFEITGMMGQPTLFLALSLSLGADLSVLAAGFVAPPKPGKIGFFRGLAFTFFLVQSLGFTVFLLELLYKKVANTETSDLEQLIWSALQGSSALILLLVSTKVWHLFSKNPSTITSEER